MEVRESKDGGRLLGFYILEADKENRGVGFTNHQSKKETVTVYRSTATARGSACRGRWSLNSWVYHIGGQRRDLWRWFHEMIKKN